MTATNKTTSAENPAGPLTGSELVRIVQAGDNFKTTTKDIAGLGYQSPLTTKGDISSFSTVNTRLPVGADGQALVVDSTQATGLSWSSTFVNFIASIVASTGATVMGFISTITGAIQRTMSSKANDTVSLFDFMTSAQISDVRAGTLTLDVSSAVQTALTNARGRRVLAPQGRYKIGTPLSITTTIGSSGTPFILQGEGFDVNGTGVNGTSFINPNNTGNVFTITNSGGVDTLIVMEDFGVFGQGSSATGGNGIFVNNSANTKIRRLWVQGHGNAGVSFFQAYGSSIEDCNIFKNRLFGILANQAFNLGNIRRCKCYANGMVWSQATANVSLTGGGNPNLGVVIEDTDVSYSGSAIPWYAVNATGINIALTSISVSSGTATATTAVAHGRTTGDLCFVTGATTAPSLNSVYAATLTVTGANTFTFPSSAPNGTYNESTLRIAPPAIGFQITGTTGLTLGGYSEDCASQAMYIGSDVSAFDIKGGYWQGANGSGLVLLDNCSNGKLGAMQMAGINAGVYMGQTTRQHGVDVQSSVFLASGAFNTTSTVYMIDGEYYSNAVPNSGNWVKGIVVNNNSSSAATASGWYRLTTGSGNVLNTDWAILQPSVMYVTQTVATVGAATATLDLSTCNMGEVILSAAATGLTLTMTNDLAFAGGVFEFRVISASTGAGNVTFPANWKTNTGVNTIGYLAGKSTTIRFRKDGNGVWWQASQVANVS